MMKMAVLEGKDRKYASILVQKSRENALAGKGVQVCQIVSGACAGEYYDTVFAAPNAQDCQPCSARVLLAFEADAPRLLQKISAASVVTYGTEKSTLTLSSLGEKCVVAIQREMVDCNGAFVEIGETTVDVPCEDALSACGIAGAIILSAIL